VIAENGWDFYDRLWRPGQLVVSDMERHGVRFDRDASERAREEFASRAALLETSLNLWAKQELNWGSWQQKQQFLYGTTVAAATKKGPLITPKGFDPPPVSGTLMAVKMVRDGEEPTSAAAIKHLADHCEDPEDREGLKTLLEYTETTKLLSFCEGLPRFVGADGRIHPQLGAITETGRLSSRNPNLQNIPIRTELGRKLRELFIAESGNVLLALDYGALEWRILAHVLAFRYSDTSLVDEVVAGVDPHIATAVYMGLMPGPASARQVEYEATKQWKRERDIGKILNYAVNYGKTGPGLGVQIKDPNGHPIGTKRGQALLDGFFRARPGIARFHKDIVDYADKHGYVRSLLGRPRQIPEMRCRCEQCSRGRSCALRRRGERLAKNVIQNCAADVVTAAMVKCHRLLSKSTNLVLQIHDELLFECDEDEAHGVQEAMRHAMETCLEGLKDFRCPLAVSGGFGPTWGAAH
jgi:DNA polymerase I